jgi:uncharacterized membrane protein YhhN
MQTKEKILVIVFAIASLGNLVAAHFHSAVLDYTTKPLLLLSLLVAWQSTQQPSNPFSKLIAGAFLFSWFGDLLLLLVSSPLNNQVPFFILGLGSFLVAHLFFIWAFWLWKGTLRGIIQLKPWLLLPFVLFWALLIYLVWPGLGDLRIPVLAYSLVIIVMTASAHNLGNLLTTPHYWYLSIGTIMFVLSDGLIAINKFTTLIPPAPFWIMLTYIVAQYLIYLGAKGMARSN